MRFPENLRDGGTIGFVAPSFGCSIEPYQTSFNHSLEKWAKMGYRTVLGPNVYASDGIGISTSPYRCGKELTESYLSDESDILISCGGGELMCEILDDVDFAAIKAAKPKWYMGYSDNTNFTFLLTTLCDTASIYGPCAPAFGMEPWHTSLDDALALLKGEKLWNSGYDGFETESLKDEEHPLMPYHITRERVLHYRTPDRKEEISEDAAVKMEGRLIGGCLDCLVNLAGTCYDHVEEFARKYQDDGIIWFLESCDLNVFSMRRALWELQHAGWFDHVKGFLIGRPMHHEETMMGLDQYRAVTDILDRHGVPVIMDLDIGHLPPMMPLICGSYVKVDADGQSFHIEMQCR